MAERIYGVVYDGALVEGADPAAVKQRLAALLKVSPQQVERLFQGPITLKKGLSLEAAGRLAGGLRRAGAVGKVVRLGGAPAPAGLAAQDIARAFAGEFVPRAPARAYLAGLAAVSLLMLLLPLLYLGLIVGLIAALLWYGLSGPLAATHNPVLLFLLALPLVAGVVMVLFLLKPFFAPRAPAPFALHLRRSEQPLLFAFIDAIADKVGAPRPRSVEVDCLPNAAASYHHGLRGLRGNELSLVVGLPLLAGMNTRQLAGVLAHEFGHFSQRAGMSATYIIRRINYEFHRAVAERDAWDERLSRWVEEQAGPLAAVAGAAQLGVGLVRRILAGFLWVGEAISAYMLRQMEFDADTYEARLTGSAQFRATSLRLRHLGWAFGATQSELGALWDRRQLVDDLPTAVARKAAEVPPDVAEEIEASLAEHTGDLFASHPPDEARIEAAEALQAPGIFTLERPAHALLANRSEIARQATLRYYRHTLGVDVTPAQLVSLETMATVVAETRRQERALRDYWRSVFVRSRYLTPARVESMDEVARRHELDDLVRRLRRMLPEVDLLKERRERVEAQLPPAFAAQVLTQAAPSLRSVLARLAERGHAELQVEAERLHGEAAKAETMLRRRFSLALEGAREWAGLDAAARDTLARVLRTAQALRKLQSVRDELRLSAAVLHYGLQADAAARRESRGAEGLPGSLLELWYRRTRQGTGEIEAALKRVPYPLPSSVGVRSAWVHIGDQLPAGHNRPHELVDYALALVEALDALHQRLMGYLADVAGRYEQALGVEPLSLARALPDPRAVAPQRTHA
ncbi:M48 family metalloprotease [Ectothiorhodospiraceae bacterium 2226]|nr:M48 family metalloprotease [Ectothiorhodospiraceae bacterium 2226]